jgi:hypothetical protein
MTLREKFDLFKAQLRGAIRSKTVLINAALLALLDQLPNILNYAAEQLPVLQPYLGAELFRNAMLTVLVLNILLRFRTKIPLEAK